MLKSDRRWSDDITRLTLAVGGAWNWWWNVTLCWLSSSFIDYIPTSCRLCYLNAWSFKILIYNVPQIFLGLQSRIWDHESDVYIRIADSTFRPSLTFNFLCRIPQSKSKCMQEYHALNSAKFWKDWAKGKNQKIKIQLLYMWKSRPIGINSLRLVCVDSMIWP